MRTQPFLIVFLLKQRRENTELCDEIKGCDAYANLFRMQFFKSKQLDLDLCLYFSEQNNEHSLPSIFSFLNELALMFHKT